MPRHRRAGSRRRLAPSPPVHAVASSSRAPPPAQAVASSSTGPPLKSLAQPSLGSVEELSRELEQKLMTGAPATKAGTPPASSKAGRFPSRSGFGTLGKKCVVKANHFLVEVADRDLHQYDVTITPEVTSRKVNRDVISQLVQMYRKSHLGKRRPAYDGRKSLYTAGPFPFESKEFVVKLADKDDHASGSKKRDLEFRVAIKFASKVNIYHLRQFLSGRLMDNPQETMQVLDVVLRESPSKLRTTVGRYFFSTDFGTGELGDGIEYWSGFYQSLRPTQMGLSLNIDVTARSFYEPILVTEFVAKCFQLRDLSKPLSEQDRKKIKVSLRGLIVVPSHMKHAQSYKITGLSNQPLGQLLFTLDDKSTDVTVVNYFRQKYNIVLKYTCWPAIQAGSDSKPIYLPMELCRIVEGQRYTKRLNERQVTALLRATCQRPHERENSIKGMVSHNNYNEDELVSDEFGIQVKEEITFVDARVLPPPMLKYHESGAESRVDPRQGQWNMINKVGGWNTVLNDAVERRIPFVSDRPTIIFGADVIHPSPGQDSRPSIAAVVASMDWPEVTKYRGLVSAQAHREEIIQDLYKSRLDPQRGLVHSGMIWELLIAFRRETGRKPERIILYREGVSEGQFYQVLLYEMDAIRKACNSMEAEYLPPVTNPSSLTSMQGALDWFP